MSLPQTNQFDTAVNQAQLRENKKKRRNQSKSDKEIPRF